jgi:hypothetical protein
VIQIPAYNTNNQGYITQLGPKMATKQNPIYIQLLQILGPGEIQFQLSKVSNIFLTPSSKKFVDVKG